MTTTDVELTLEVTEEEEESWNELTAKQELLNQTNQKDSK